MTARRKARSINNLRRMVRRRRQAGMTLVEIMIVVIIMALIATAVGVALLPQLDRARQQTARSDAEQIRSGVIQYVAENPGDCPSMDDLVSEGYIDENRRTTDPWDNDFEVECEGTSVTVLSVGPDGQAGTDDDIVPGQDDD